MHHLKSIFNSLVFSAAIALYALISGDLKIAMIIWGIAFVQCLIIFVGNAHTTRYFWSMDFNLMFPKWAKKLDIWIIFGGFVVMITGLFMFRIFLEDPEDIVGPYVSIPLGLIGAVIFRYGYLRNSPVDPIGFEEAKKIEEHEDTLVVVAEVKDGPSAHIIKGVLETNGIEAVIYGENLPEYLGVGNHIMPVRVLVRRKDKEKAEQIINE